MLKLVLIATFVTVSMIACADAPEINEPLCFEEHEIGISWVHPPIRILEAGDRLNSITVNLQVDCLTGELTRPASRKEAVMLLESSLPANLLAGIDDGEYLNFYKHTPYGGSVGQDLAKFFADAWKLGNDSAICAESPDSDSLEGFECAISLIEQLREQYRGGT